jgi:hypothetical protein
MYSDRDVLFLLPETLQNDFQIVGGGSQKVLIIVAKSQYGEAEQAFLSNIVKAIKLDVVQDCHIFILQIEELLIHRYLPQNYDVVLVFGLSPKQIGMQIHFVKYASLPISNATYVFVDDLLTLQSDQAIKSKLWGMLKMVFAKNLTP